MRKFTRSVWTYHAFQKLRGIFSFVLFLVLHCCSVSMASIHCLPNELLMKILSYLHVSDVSLTVSQVCRRWNELSSDRFLWSQFVFVVEEETSLRSVLSLLPHLPHLRFITIRWRTDTEDIIDMLSTQCQYLEKIHLFSCGHVKSSSVKKICDGFEYLNNFSLGKCYSIQNKSFDYVSKMKNLTALNLSHSVLNSEQFRVISTECTKINYINIDFVRGISEEDLIYFITPRKIQLLSLIVFGELLTDTIFNHIEICQQLRVLHISSCRRFSRICFESIIKLKSLRSLTLRKLVSISSMSLRSFFYNSELNQKLSYLYISAQRTFTEEDLYVWYPKNDTNMKDSNTTNSLKTKILKSKNCSLVLRKDDFSFQVWDNIHFALLNSNQSYAFVYILLMFIIYI